MRLDESGRECVAFVCSAGGHTAPATTWSFWRSLVPTPVLAGEPPTLGRPRAAPDVWLLDDVAAVRGAS